MILRILIVDGKRSAIVDLAEKTETETVCTGKFAEDEIFEIAKPYLDKYIAKHSRKETLLDG